jgi:hypothetical protein
MNFVPGYENAYWAHFLEDGIHVLIPTVLKHRARPGLVTLPFFEIFVYRKQSEN